MKNLLFISIAASLIMGACSLDPGLEPIAENTIREADQQIPANHDVGATPVSGIGVFGTPEVCDVAGKGADFALKLTGDLTGCLFVFVEDFGCSPSGTYRESGKEYGHRSL